ncbi:MAG: 3-phosphoglycerate dehydrogenase [Bacteroidetes bacterium]|nr:3-phosphoglycerate dehydrogenase [Bacteroidota bacterium]
MTKVLVATDKAFAPVAVKGIRQVIEQAGYELILLENYSSPEDFFKAVADVDAVIVRSDKTDKAVIDAAHNLKIVVRAGAGYDNIDLAAATANGVVVMNTGMEVYAFDPFIPRDAIEKDGVRWVGSVEELYSKCNFISLHIPANSQTKQSVNSSLLSRMPSPAVLVNTARAEVINEADLLKTFQERKDFAYLSDVEPANKAEIESGFKAKFFCTPKKMGAQTEEANINAGIAAARQIVNFINKGDKTFQVNK